LASLNKILLIGKISTTPSMKVTTKGDALLTFLLNVNRPQRSPGMAEQTDTINIVLWGELAETNAKVNVDDLLLVEGRIITRSYEDNEGNRKWVTEVEGREVKLLQNIPTQTPDGSEQFSAEKDSLADEFSQTLEQMDNDNTNLEDFSFDATAQKKAETESDNFEKEIEEDVPF
jgi:single-strand DNA-binding protein